MMLLQKCLNIENDLGRKRAKKNEPRICDIDIIDYGQKILKCTKNKESDSIKNHLAELSDFLERVTLVYD